MSKSEARGTGQPVQDPFGIAAHSRKAIRDASSRELHVDDDADRQVNPLWMITAGLAAFLLLLVVVW